MTPKRSLQFAFIGAGEGGGRMAAAFGRMKYRAGAINTAQADLGKLRLPQAHKLVTPIGAGGAGQDPALGQKAVLVHEPKVRAFLQALTQDADHVILCVGGGGGTGTGMAPELVRLLREMKRPVGVIYTLPRQVEGTAVKVNALRGLAVLYRLSEVGEVSPLVLVDNERVGEMFPDVSLARFWQKANFFLADLWDAFNRLSCKESEFYSALDGTDYLRILQAGKCAALGYVEARDLKSDVGLARAMSEALGTGLLADGFDLSTATAVGVIVVGSANTLQHLPARYLDNGWRVIRQAVGGGYTFTGVYADQSVYRRLKVYVLAGGMDLPARVREVGEQAQVEFEDLQGKLSRNDGRMLQGLSFMQGRLTLQRRPVADVGSGGGSIFDQLADW